MLFHALLCLAQWFPTASLSFHHAARGGGLRGGGADIEDATFKEAYRMVLNNFEDVQYTGSIKVGGQTLDGILDTGSFELLFFSTSCDGCGPMDRLYDHEASSAYKMGELNARHAYGSGDTWSHEAADRVSVGSYVAEEQWFWEVVHTEMPVLQDASFQAIIGMGIPGSALLLAERRHAETQQEADKILQMGQSLPDDVSRRLSENNRSLERARTKVDFTVNLGIESFSVCIGKEPGSPGYWTWNDAGPRRSPEVFSNIEIKGTMHWSAVLTNARIGPDATGKNFALGCGSEAGSCGALLDTGTSLLAAPIDAIEQVKVALEALDGDCDKINLLPPLRFQLGGVELELPPSSYVGHVIGEIPHAFADIFQFDKIGVTVNIDGEETSCQPLFMSIDLSTKLGPMWILGLPFFRKYYTVFDSQASEAEHAKSVFVAEADTQCMPSVNMFSLHEVHAGTNIPVTVDASKLKVPSWMQEAIGRRFVDL